MFLRKLTVILVPLGLLILICLLTPLFSSLGGFFGSLLLGFCWALPCPCCFPWRAPHGCGSPSRIFCGSPRR